MALTLITGPAASGKTETLVERCAARYADDPFAASLVLVPTSRHADQFRRRLVGRASVAFGLEVSTLSGWARDVAVEAGHAFASAAVLAELAAKAIREAAAAGEAPAFGGFDDAPGLSAPVAEAIRELVAENIAASAFRAAVPASDRRLSSLAAIYERLEGELAGRRLVHPAAGPAVGAAAVRAGLVTVPALVVVDSFDYLRAGEIDLVAALAGPADVSLALDPAASSRAAFAAERVRDTFPALTERATNHAARVPERSAFSAPDRDGELRAIARDIKQRLTADSALRPSDFGVAFRQATPVLPQARQVFREFNLPLDPAAGTSLASLPVGAWMRRLLLLGVNGWATSDLLAVLRSAFINHRRWGVDRGIIATIASAAREGKVWGELDGLRGLAANMADSQHENQVRRGRERAAGPVLEEVLGSLEPLLDPDRRDGEGALAADLESAFFDGAAPIVRPSNEARAQYEAFRGLLRGCRQAEESLGTRETTFAAFAESLLRDMERTTLALREAGGVVLAPMHTLHGLRFRYLALAGLVEGEFPATRRVPGMLEGEARALLRERGILLPPSSRASEDELFAAASTRSDGALLFSRPRLDPAGRQRAASFYFPLELDSGHEGPFAAPEQAASVPELAVAAARAWPQRALRPVNFAPWPTVRRAALIEPRRMSFETAGSFEGQLDPALAGELVTPATRWSASRLENYNTCGFQYFGAYGLGLRELDREHASADAAVFGTVVHTILDAAIEPLVEAAQALDASTLPAVMARIDKHGKETWDDAPAKYGFGRAGLWRLRWQRVRDRIERMLENEASSNEGLGIDRVLGTELALNIALPLHEPMSFTGKVDRVDFGGGTAVVVDYKSGRSIPQKDVEAGDRLQLQLYAAALREQDPAISRVVSRFAYLRPTPPKDRASIDTSANEATVQAALERATDIRERIRGGRFGVVPGPYAEEVGRRTCPTYCVFRHSCRVNPMSRWKTWD